MSENRIHIARMAIQDSGTYTPQYSRSYVAECKPQTLDSLQRRIDQASRVDPHAGIGGSLIAGMSSGLIIPSAEAAHELIIPQGWDSKRLRFLLEVHCESPFGIKIFYLNGYSEYNGLQDNGLTATIDPKMRFYINSFIVVNRVEDFSGMSATGYRDTIVESAHVVNGRIHSDDGRRSVYGLRPYDMYVGIQSSYLRQDLENFAGGTVSDDRIGAENSVMKSSRRNNVPALYLSKLIDTYRSANTLADYGNGTDDIYNRAIQSTIEPEPFENDFIRAINDLYGHMDVVWFTLEDLDTLDPGCVRDRVEYFEIAQGYPVHQAQDSEHWGGSGLQQQAATIIGHGVSALMMECMLIQMAFTYTNRIVGGGVECFPINTDSPIGVTSADLSPFIDRFFRMFCEDVMPDVTSGGMIGMDVNVFADLFGDTRIEISIEGGPLVPFVIPQFADALRVPTVTTDPSVYNTLVSGVEEIVNSVTPTTSLSRFVAKDI